MDPVITFHCADVKKRNLLFGGYDNPHRSISLDPLRIYRCAARLKDASDIVIPIDRRKSISFYFFLNNQKLLTRTGCYRYTLDLSYSLTRLDLIRHIRYAYMGVYKNEPDEKSLKKAIYEENEGSIKVFVFLNDEEIISWDLLPGEKSAWSVFAPPLTSNMINS